MGSNKGKITHVLKKFWHFVWEEDSLASWIVNVILAFLIIRFLIYPGLSVAFGTELPIVAVVSGSMEHDIVQDGILRNRLCGKEFPEEKDLDFNEYWETCGSWYEQGYNFSKENFSKFPFKDGFNKGDIMLLKSGNKPESVKAGDVIVFQSIHNTPPIIHRVVEIHKQEINRESEKYEYSFTTKGDHNEKTYKEIGEDSIDESRYIGKAFLRVPYLGWIKISAMCGLNIIKGNSFIHCMNS